VVRLPEETVVAARRQAANPAPTDRNKFSPTVIKGDFKSAGNAAAPANGNEAVELQMLGRIAAGTPIEALTGHNASVSVPPSLIGSGDHYALEVAGDSMIDAGIMDGDTVLIQKTEHAENGAIVVALVDSNEVTLKRLRKRGDSIALEPANKAYETRIFGPDRVKVQGKLVGLMRRY
jgi:repressor LexA